MRIRVLAAERCWPRAFTQPAWWCALGLLLLNDHVLKGGALCPPALTGKLSDFAGLIVAPPLVALALGAHRKHSAALAIASVGIGFSLIKTVPVAAHAFESSIVLLVGRAHVWLDASDLWALCVLPFAARLCKATPREAAICIHGSQRVRISWARRAGLALSAAACLATSGFGGGSDKRTDAPEVENSTSDALTLILASTDGAGGCSLYVGDRVALLTPDAFGSARTLTLKAGQRAALPADTTTSACGAASIGLPDGSETRVYWHELAEIASFVADGDPRRTARRVAISGKLDAFKAALGSDLHPLDLGGMLPAANCMATQPMFSLEVSALSEAPGFLRLGDVRTDQDGCIEADWFSGADESSPDTQRLCLPDWAFPFTAGQTLSATQDLGDGGVRSLHLAQFSGSAIKTELVVWNDDSSFDGGLVKSFAASDCVGTRLDCGAYERPALASVRGNDKPLGPGKDATIHGTSPKTTRVLIGTARDVSWTGAQCTGADAHVGITANVLELRSY